MPGRERLRRLALGAVIAGGLIAGWWSFRGPGTPMPPCLPDEWVMSQLNAFSESSTLSEDARRERKRDYEALVQQAKWASEHPKVNARVVSVVSPDTVKVMFLDDCF